MGTEKRPIGFYEPDSKGIWTVKIEKDSYMTVKRQEDAEILSFLARIEERLKRIERKVK
jgi:hypothetical protein